MSEENRHAVIFILIGILIGIILSVVVATVASATPCEDTDPCGAEPSPLPRVYVPLVTREVPAMSAEYTPAQPVPTVTPEVQP